MARADGGWHPTAALVRAATASGLLGVVAVVAGRPDLLVLAAPLLTRLYLGGQSTTADRSPPGVKVGTVIDAWASNGDRLVGTWTVLEVRDNWALVAEDPKDKNASRFWMNFDNVVHYRVVK